jgi:hypothetical protein
MGACGPTTAIARAAESDGDPHALDQHAVNHDSPAGTQPDTTGTMCRLLSTLS